MSDLESTEPRPSSAAERQALRTSIAWDAIAEARDRPGPRWLRRLRVRAAEREWLTALEAVNSRDHDEQSD